MKAVALELASFTYAHGALCLNLQTPEGVPAFNLRVPNHLVEQAVRGGVAELQRAQFEILERLAVTAEHRDGRTAEHTRRVGRLSALVADAIGWPAGQVELIGCAARLHDIGKIGIPESILLKPHALTAQEFEMLRAHTRIGASILAGSSLPLLQMAEKIALTHHERWDGTGYTPGFRGQVIPQCGRIVALVDVFDALTHERPYKEAWPIDRAIDWIQRGRGLHFDPSLVDAFVSLSPTDLLSDAA
ncbi:MAG: HD-GYP domain-containing protein [Acidobacteriota bacterium]